MSTVIKVENVSKQYRLGQVGTGSLAHDVNRFWHTLRGKEDPYLKIGEENDRSVKGNSEYVWALKDINFEVKHGEVLGIIGRNGAGKSTLLKILSRTTTPTTGTIKIKGRVASLLEVGTGFHPELSGRDNIFLNGAILGMTKQEIKSKFDEIVDFSGVERYIDTPVKRYSSGMYVRLAFGVAAHLEPEILIVDEVLAVGDAEFQKKAMGKMKDVSANQGRTVLLVSHNIDSIFKLTQNCLYLNNGFTAFIGPTHYVVNEYLSVSSNRKRIFETTDPLKRAYISRAEILTSMPNNVHCCEERLELIFHLTVRNPIKNACFSFQIVDSLDKAYIHLWIFDSDQPLCRERGTHSLKCIIPSLKLYMGNYTLKCYFSEPAGGEMFDIIENVCPFEVVMYKQLRENFQWLPNTCSYLENASWVIE